jgi:hypothetical protein
MWDPTDCTPSVYLDFVPFWPNDGFLQPKHVAKILNIFKFLINICRVLDGNKISRFHPVIGHEGP